MDPVFVSAGLATGKAYGMAAKLSIQSIMGVMVVLRTAVGTPSRTISQALSIEMYPDSINIVYAAASVLPVWAWTLVKQW